MREYYSCLIIPIFNLIQIESGEQFCYQKDILVLPFYLNHFDGVLKVQFCDFLSFIKRVSLSISLLTNSSKIFDAYKEHIEIHRKIKYIQKIYIIRYLTSVKKESIYASYEYNTIF